MHSTNHIGLLRRLLVLAALLALLLGGCRGFTFEKPPIHPNLNMDFQTHFGAQQKADFWEDGRSMRPQVEGTVARGMLRLDTVYYEGRDDAGNWIDELPVELSESLLARGEDRYEVFCTPCHGSSGYGEGVVSERAVWIVPSFHAERARSMSIGHIYDIIANGQNTMPGYRTQMSVEDRWAVAAYLRALQVSQGLELDMLPREIAQQQGWRAR